MMPHQESASETAPRSIYDPGGQHHWGGQRRCSKRLVQCGECVELRSIRLKAAIAAAPFVHSKHSVTAVTDDAEDFAARLQRAMRRSAKVIEGRAEPPEP